MKVKKKFLNILLIKVLIKENNCVFFDIICTTKQNKMIIVCKTSLLGNRYSLQIFFLYSLTICLYYINNKMENKNQKILLISPNVSTRLL